MSALPNAASTSDVPRPLLRADQIEEMEGEKENLEGRLSSKDPRVDKGEAAAALRRLTHQLETQRPMPYEGPQLDRAVKREAELRAQIQVGMLSHEEMRKCPPGAVDRHRTWERENKSRIAEWQFVQRRLNAGNDNREIASIENFRPLRSTMNMDNALIEGTKYLLPPAGADPVVPFDDDDIALIAKHAPELAMRLATMDNTQRGELKRVLVQLRAEAVA